ncbi:hypothetical protein [Microbacterium sp.]|uniref:hypothetical protein n=1 Tax=Microbacterium sp. TaxID=51671 RepID=UPI0039E28227
MASDRIVERLGQDILAEHARLRTVRCMLLCATALSIISVIASAALLAGWTGEGAGTRTLGWVAAGVSAVAVPLCALLATGVRRGRRYVLAMIAEYDRLRARAGAAQ